jgi:1,2-diacylglycerol 3-alpha-glucosyltransferase/glucuronosyltransferase
VIGSAEVGVLSEDLRLACLAALKLSPQDCREFAASQGWEASARAFVNNIRDVPAETCSALRLAPEQPRLAT